MHHNWRAGTEQCPKTRRHTSTVGLEKPGAEAKRSSLPPTPPTQQEKANTFMRKLVQIVFLVAWRLCSAWRLCFFYKALWCLATAFKAPRGTGQSEGRGLWRTAEETAAAAAEAEQRRQRRRLERRRQRRRPSGGGSGGGGGGGRAERRRGMQWRDGGGGNDGGGDDNDGGGGDDRQ